MSTLPEAPPETPRPPAAGAPGQDAMLRAVVEAMPKLVWTATPDGAVDHANSSWLEYTGLRLEEALGDGWAAAVHPEDRERVVERWRECVRARAPYEATYRLRRASDGAHRWFLERASPMFGADGALVRWLGTIDDIDDHRRAVEVQRFVASAGVELAKSLDYEVTLRKIARLAVPRLADWCAVDLLDPGGALRRVAVAHTDPAKEALAVALVERYPPDPDDPNDGLYRVVRTGQSERVADIPPELVELAAKDAEHLEVVRALQLRSYIAVPLEARGRILGVLSLVSAESRRSYTEGDQAVAEDLARRAALAIDSARLFRDLQQSAGEIRALNEALEARVRDRTAQLEEANRELESFCYSVSHDLRAPLRHISGFAQLLDRRAGASLDPQSRGYVETIVESARQGARLVDDLLAFSRLGRSALTLAPVALSDLVAAVRRDLASDAEGRAVTWRVGPLPEVAADANLLRFALKNLLGNALKYTRPRAEAVIEISAREDGGEVELCVRDNGVGFDPQFGHKLFGVFQRLHTAEEFEGNGIGLANVRRIVARHGGRTWAEGAVGQGASFHLTLPRPHPPEEPPS